MSWKLCEMKHQRGHDAIWRGVCHDLEKSQGTKFFFLHQPNTLTTFEVHGISSQNCLTLNSIGFSNAISCSTRSDELVNCQNSLDI